MRGGTSNSALCIRIVPQFRNNPQFQVILCQADTDLPQMMPVTAPGTKTLVVQAGHKGQHVGVLGAFKKADGTFDFKYQLVPMGEEYITPGKDEDARKTAAVCAADSARYSGPSSQPRMNGPVTASIFSP